MVINEKLTQPAIIIKRIATDPAATTAPGVLFPVAQSAIVEPVTATKMTPE